MGDLQSRRLMVVKGILFLTVGAIAAGLVLAESPRARTGVLLAVAIWAFARAYYFAFYVIERYIDPSYRFAGLGSAVRYLWGQRGK